MADNASDINPTDPTKSTDNTTEVATPQDVPAAQPAENPTDAAEGAGHPADDSAALELGGDSKSDPEPSATADGAPSDDAADAGKTGDVEPFNPIAGVPSDAEAVTSDAPAAQDDASAHAGETAPAPETDMSGTSAPAEGLGPVATASDSAVEPAPLGDQAGKSDNAPTASGAASDNGGAGPLDSGAEAAPEATNTAPTEDTKLTSSDSSATPTQPGDSSNGSQGEVSINAPGAVLPPTQHAPMEHPKPATEPRRVDPTTGIELPPEQQPKGPMTVEVPEQPKAGDAEGMAQDGANEYEDKDSFRAELDKLLGHVRSAMRHEGQMVKNSIHKLEQKIVKLIERMKKGS